MSRLIFSCDGRDYVSRRGEFRGPQGHEYYEGDYQILPGPHISVRIDKGVDCTFPIFNLQTRTNLRFSRGWSHIRHDKADMTIVWFVKRGHLVISNEFGRHLVHSGECTITRSSQPFLIENVVDELSVNEVLHVVVPTHLVRSLIPDGTVSGNAFSFRRGDCHLAERLLLAVYAEGDCISRDVADDMVSAALKAVGRTMCRLEAEIPRVLNHKRFTAILSYIERHLSNPDLSLTAVAEGCAISARYLCLVLRANHTRFSEVLWRRRVERAQAWLRSEHMHLVPIKRVAYMAGFKCPAHFSRSFKRITGMTPREFREGKYLPGRRTGGDSGGLQRRSSHRDSLNMCA